MRESVADQLVPSQRVLVEHLQHTHYHLGHHDYHHHVDHYDNHVHRNRLYHVDDHLDDQVKFNDHEEYLHPELWPALESTSGVMYINLSRVVK